MLIEVSERLLVRMRSMSPVFRDSEREERPGDDDEMGVPRVNGEALGI